jgi:murein DD-endopeptidase MepM/ murein hydrolase activator NlpD
MMNIFIPINEFAEPPSRSLHIGGAPSYKVGGGCADPNSIDYSRIVRDWPLDSIKINQGFTTWRHPALDLNATYGTEIKSVGYGFVDTAEYMPGGYGWHVIIEHPEGWKTLYAHMWVEPYVEVGDYVVPGKVLGIVGSTGKSSGPHLHFEILHDDCNMNPYEILN